MKNFALIGAAGYVAPKHMKAIKEVGGNLVAALDPHDSVGVLDQYFPECAFFTEFERFDRFCSKNQIDYVSIASPNYLHQSHCMFALRIGADAICEKPLVLTEHNLDELARWEGKFGKRVWNVLQCRLHPAVREFPSKDRSYVKINYVTPRGRWLDYAWKSDIQKSGGLSFNIGVHLFDLVSFLFGKSVGTEVCKTGPRSMVGFLRLEGADVDWLLSTEMTAEPKRTFEINGMMCDLTNGFTDLHTKVYQEIMAGRGFGLEDTREAIRICESIRNQL